MEWHSFYNRQSAYYDTRVSNETESFWRGIGGHGDQRRNGNGLAGVVWMGVEVIKGGRSIEAATRASNASLGYPVTKQFGLCNEGFDVLDYHQRKCNRNSLFECNGAWTRYRLAKPEVASVSLQISRTENRIPADDQIHDKNFTSQQQN